MTWTSCNSKLYFSGFASAIAAISLALTLGCHPLSNRFKSPSAGIDASTEDDWAPPKTSQSRYSQPQPYVRRTKTSETENSQASRTSGAIQPAEYQSPPKVDAPERTTISTSAKNLKAHDGHSEAKSASNIQETNEQALDIEGALDALPANFREVARRQLEAIRSSQSPAEADLPIEPSNAKAVASMTSKETPVLTEPTAIAQVKLGVPQASETKPSSKVFAKLTDQTAAELAPAAHSESSAQIQTTSKTMPIIANAVATKTDESDSVSTASATSSKMAVPNPHWNSSVNEAISKLERDLNDDSTQDENIRLNQELTLRLLYLANRQLNSAMRPIDGLEVNEKDYFRHQLQALYEAGNPDAMPVKSRRWSLVMNSQRQATNHLAAASSLEVRSLAFCTDVQGFGVLTKFPHYQFKPDQEILLYCELENVLAQQVKAGFETELQGTYEIIDPSGRRVAEQLLPMEKEICQNHRRDYFIIYHIFMPMQIAPGNYQMRVMIEDMKASKFGQANLDFQIQK